MLNHENRLKDKTYQAAIQNHLKYELKLDDKGKKNLKMKKMVILEKLRLIFKKTIDKVEATLFNNPISNIWEKTLNELRSKYNQ